MKRTVFFISDGTGITAEALGASLISQFEEIEFHSQTFPYVDTAEKAQRMVETINQAASESAIKPLVFTTLINPEIRKTISLCEAKVFDLFQAFLAPIEAELQAKSSYTIGRSHSVFNSAMYQARMEAINFALSKDDGLGSHSYSKADVVIIGVSRCGKTPTCLYLALQFGVWAANYPLTPEDIMNDILPKPLQHYKNKVFGLTIEPSRLQDIRHERKPHSRYASLEQCRQEVSAVEALFKHENIPFLNTTTLSIEEIATKILALKNIPRKVF